MSKEFSYGGQAVIEGVMMRGRRSMAIAVRRPDRSIVVENKPVKTLVLGWAHNMKLYAACQHIFYKDVRPEGYQGVNVRLMCCHTVSMGWVPSITVNRPLSS